jgi:hypothetical protein
MLLFVFLHSGCGPDPVESIFFSCSFAFVRGLLCHEVVKSPHELKRPQRATLPLKLFHNRVVDFAYVYTY